MANNTNWLNISQTTGGTGQTALSLTALTNTSLQPKTATITARNPEHNVSDTTTVTIQGFQPTLTLSRSTIRFDSTGGTATFTVYSNTSWTIQFPSLVRSYSASAGTGDMEISVVVGPNPDETGKVDTAIVKDTYNVNQLFLTVVQDSFIAELTVTPDSDIVFVNTGSSTSVTIESNTDWEITCPSWVTPSVVSGSSGTTTVTFTAGENGPTDRSGDITITAGSKEVVINAFQPFYIPAYITVTPSSWEFNYTEDGKTFIVDSYPSWSGEIVATGETAWDTAYMEATFEIPSAMTMPLYTSAGSTTAVYLGPIRHTGSTVTFESAGTYTVRYEIGTGGTTPAIINNTYLTKAYITEGITAIGGFSGCSSLNEITCLAATAPTVKEEDNNHSIPGSFTNVSYNGSLIYPVGSDYSSWLALKPSFLGYYNWNNAGIEGAIRLANATYVVSSTTTPTPLISSGQTYWAAKPYAVRYGNEDIMFLSGASSYTFPATGSQRLDLYYLPNPSVNLVYNAALITISFNDTVNVTDVTIYDYDRDIPGYPQQNVQLAAGASITALTQNTDVTLLNSTGSTTTIKSTNIEVWHMQGSTTTFDTSHWTTGNTLREVVITASGMTSLPDYAFEDCSSLTSVTLSNSITSIGQYAFSHCPLTNIVLPSGVTTLKQYCFEYTPITDLDIPNSVTTVGTAVFSYCTSLTGVTIGSGLTTFGNYTFNHCTALSAITFPATVSNLGGYTFDGCTNLLSITMLGTTAPTSSGTTFRHIKDLSGTLYYPAGSDYSSILNRLTNWTGVEINVQ